MDHGVRIIRPMRLSFFNAVGGSGLLAACLLGLLAGCGGESSIKPAEVMDERTGVTVGALQEPIEFMPRPQNAANVTAKRVTFAYLGPVEWDRMGDISYGLWIHVAPGNDRQLSDIRARGAVTLNLDDGPMTLTALDTAPGDSGPYKPVVSWGQTAYFALDVGMLKRMAASDTFSLDFRAADATTVNFQPNNATRETLSEFARARGITDD